MAFFIHPETDFRTCGACRQLYHVNELKKGRGRQFGQHPEHRYAPCGHSQDWHGWEPAYVEPEPATGLEFFEPDYGGAWDGFTVTSDADPGL